MYTRRTGLQSSHCNATGLGVGCLYLPLSSCPLPTDQSRIVAHIEHDGEWDTKVYGRKLVQLDPNLRIFFWWRYVTRQRFWLRQAVAHRLAPLLAGAGPGWAGICLSLGVCADLGDRPCAIMHIRCSDANIPIYKERM